MESIQVPFHFTSTFLVTIASAAGLLLSLRRPDFGPEGLWPRFFFRVGWALLLLGEVTHGSLIAEGELEPTALALRAGGYAFIVVSLLPAPKRKEAVAAAGVSGSQALMPSLLAVAAFLLALRSRIEGSRRLAVAFALLAGSEVFFGIGGTDPSSAAGVPWFVAHGLRLAGGLAIGAWVWTAFRSSIQVRFIAAFVALLMVVVIALSSAMTQVFAGNVRRNELQQAALEGRSQQVALDEQRDELIRLSKLAAGLPSVRDGVARSSSSALQESARVFQAPGGLFEQLDFMAFLDESAAILAISDAALGGGAHLGEADRIGLAGTDVVQVSLQQKIEAGSIDAIGTSTLAVISSAPVFNPPGLDPPGAPQGLAGAVALGIVIDLDYLKTLQRETLEFSAISRDMVLATTLPQPNGLLEADLRSVLEKGEVANHEASLGDEEFFSSYIPLKRTDGRIVGALVVSRPSEVLDLTQRNVGQTLFGLALVAAAIAVGSSYFTGTRITRPIIDLTGAARRVREGDLEARAQVEAGDEVGALGATFNEMVASLGRLTGDLRSAATQLETILQSLTDGVVAIDDQGQVVAFNREAVRITGKNQNEVKGRRIQDVLVATDTSGGRISLPVYRLERGALSTAYVSHDSDSARTPVAITSAPIKDDNGGVVGAVAILRDLTSELALEKAKTEFLSNISHELNTPLTPIKGYAEMLRRRKVPRTKAVSMLDGILSSTRRLKRIVDMLIDVSSMEAGRLTVKREPLDFGKMTTELIEEWKKEAPKHRFERRGFRNLPKLEGDKRLLSRAIDELIDNAIKFSPKGGRVALIAEVGRSRGNKGLRLTVADQGIGISESKLAEIFDEFTQVDASETRAYGGLGLGLSYVRRAVEAHGGHLEVKSTSRGSSFSIILAAAEIPETPRHAARRSASTRASRGPISKRE